MTGFRTLLLVRWLGLYAVCAAWPAALPAQDTLAPLSRGQAVESALARGARLGVARADAALASAQLLTARAFQNPVLSPSYSKSTPQYHVIVDLPLDYPGLRQARVRAAQSGRLAAELQLAFTRAAVALDADTTYTRSLAARERAALSRRNAEAADSLRRIAIARRDAGDASTLDVELATVNAGQQANLAAADSLAFVSTLLDLQAIIGIAANRVVIVPRDSLTLPPAVATVDSGIAAPAARVPLPVAAAQASLQSAQFAVGAQHHTVFIAPSIAAGFETGDPSHAEPGILPTVGFALPLPLFNRNRGPIAEAEAQRERARAELALARLETEAQVARARREREVAFAKIDRDQRLVASADRVAALSLTAYREGAASLPNVLEAQRSARDVRAQYVDDLASAWIATATLRTVTLTSTASTGP